MTLSYFKLSICKSESLTSSHKTCSCLFIPHAPSDTHQPPISQAKYFLPPLFGLQPVTTPSVVPLPRTSFQISCLSAYHVVWFSSACGILGTFLRAATGLDWKQNHLTSFTFSKCAINIQNAQNSIQEMFSYLHFL